MTARIVWRMAASRWKSEVGLDIFLMTRTAGGFLRHLPEMGAQTKAPGRFPGAREDRDSSWEPSASSPP